MTTRYPPLTRQKPYVEVCKFRWESCNKDTCQPRVALPQGRHEVGPGDEQRLVQVLGQNIALDLLVSVGGAHTRYVHLMIGGDTRGYLKRIPDNIKLPSEIAKCNPPYIKICPEIAANGGGAGGIDMLPTNLPQRCPIYVLY